MEDDGLSALGRAAVGYAEMGLPVFPLVPGKKFPLTDNGFYNWSTDPGAVREYWARNPTANIGVATGTLEVSRGDPRKLPEFRLLVLDLDCKGGVDGRDALRKWEEEYGRLPDTVAQMTPSGGVHLFYRTDQDIGSSQNGAIGVDVRATGGFAVMPPSTLGEGLEYEFTCSFEDMDDGLPEADGNVLAFTSMAQEGCARSSADGEWTKLDLPDVIPEHGGPGCPARDEAIFKLAASCRSHRVPQGEAERICLETNRERCVPPLSKLTVLAKVKSAYKYKEGKSERFQKEVEPPPQAPQPQPEERPDWHTKRGALRHNVLARWVIDKYHATFIDGMPAIWMDGSYVVGEDALKRAITEEEDAVTEAQRREVVKYISIKCRHLDKGQADPRYIAFSNGVLDIETMGLSPATPDLLIPNTVPHRWNPGAECPALDKAVSGWACGNRDIETQLWETFGLCLYRGHDLADCPVLSGEGSNGKSTYLNTLSKVVGEENVSSLDLGKVGERFQSVVMMGKLANIGDDISNDFISGDKLSVVKKAISGDWVGAEYKGGETFRYRPYATQVFSCNNMPRLGDNSGGMYRRFKSIPFDADFSEGSPSRDNGMEAQLSSEECFEYAIVRGVAALKEALARGHMTVSDKGNRKLDELKKDNSTVLQFLEDEYALGEEGAGMLRDRAIAGVYEEYADYCGKAGLKAVSRRKFTGDVLREVPLQSRPKRVTNGLQTKVVRMFSPKSDDKAS